MALIVFPFTFVSSAYVPIATMPGWMQAFARNQPITPMVDAVRSLVLGGPHAAGLTGTTAHYVVVSLIWSVVLVAVFVPDLGAALPPGLGSAPAGSGDAQSGRSGTDGASSRPSSTVLVMAPEPNRSRTPSSATSRAATAAGVERQRELDRRVVAQVGHGHAHEGEPLLLDERRGRCQQLPRRGQHRRGVGGGFGHRVRPGGPGEVVEAQPQHDGAPDAPGAAHAARHPIDQCHEHGIDPGRRARPATQCALRAHRPAATTDLHRARIEVVGQRVQVVARRRPEQRRPARLRPARPPRPPCGCPDRAASPRSRGPHPRGARPAAGAGRPARRRAPRPGGRRAWPHRWPPWPGTWCGPRRP